MSFRATYVLILATILPYVMGLAWPLRDDSTQWLLLYGFSHWNGLHLLFNLLAILTFGLGIERRLGGANLLILYTMSIIAGGTLHVLFGPDAAVIGASAGVYGLLMCYALHNAHARVMFLVFPMRAMTLAYIAVGVEILMVLFGWMPAIAHWAHIGGATFGLGYGIGSRKWNAN